MYNNNANNNAGACAFIGAKHKFNYNFIAGVK